VRGLTGGFDRHYDINGTVKSQEEFKYLEPQLLGVNPPFGPYAGGTNVTIVGKNLHIGSKRNIFFAGIECKEVYLIRNLLITCTLIEFIVLFRTKKNRSITTALL
jgi:hypothetical protein